jgi:hypothetical protein
MSGTIDAIQSRLSPKRVLADAKDSMTEATVAGMTRLTNASRSDVWQRMQDNRCPLRCWRQPPLGCSCDRGPR